MYGGNIYGNASYSWTYKGNVSLQNSSVGNMTGGTIENTGNYVFVVSGSKLHMSGTARIEANVTANWLKSGICIINADMDMTGGSVTGGTYIEVYDTGTFTVSGNSMIGEDTSYTKTKVYLRSGAKITIGPEGLADDVSITVESINGATADTPTDITNASGADYSQHFTSVWEWYGIRNSGTGENQVVQLVELSGCTVSFDANGGTGTMPTEDFYGGVSKKLWKNRFTLDGYHVVGWNTKADGTGTAYSIDDSYTFTEDTLLYAQWEPDQYLVTLDRTGGTGRRPPDPSLPVVPQYREE